MKNQRKYPILSGKKLLILLALLCMILSFATALHADLFLWEIENGENKVYLLGSIHLMPESVYPLDEKIESAFEESDILAVEVDATTVDQQAINTFIITNAMYSDSTTLESELPPELYANVALEFEKLGYTKAQFNTFKPWFASLNIGLAGLQKLNVKTGLGIDVHFLNKAHDKEMEILELETATSQLEMIASFPEDIQVDYLAYSLDEYENSDSTFKKMLSAWQAGDTKQANLMSRVKMLELEDEMPGMAEYYNRMFPEREEQIIEKIVGYLEDDEEHVYFIIVGAFHLVGDDGLIQCLQDKGYKTIQQKAGSDEKK